MTDSTDYRRQDANGFDFGHALVHLRLGKKVARAGWNGKGMWIALLVSEEPTSWRPYIYMSTVDMQLVPWVASQTDLLADDWVLVH